MSWQYFGRSNVLGRRRVLGLLGLVLTVLLPVVRGTRPAHAACNLIPGTEQTFDAALGATNRPFAAPGEPLEIRIRPCDTASTAPTGFVDPAGDYVVTVIFTPTGFSHHAVILSTNCSFFDMTAEMACEAQLGTGQAQCVTVGTPADLEVVTRNGDQRLSVRFPDTDDRVGTLTDDRTLSGPATIAVTKVGDALPCQLATQACTPQTGLVACIDRLFASDGACQRQVALGTFSHFTALPVPNDYGRCFDEIPPCSPQTPDEFRVTTDAAGNVLVPMDWRAVLVQQNQVPVPRLLRATLGPPTVPITIPGKSFVASYTPEGGLLPPIFEPQHDPSAPSGVLTLFGSADAPYTILRVARRSETFQQCSGGANDGLPCNEAADCPVACVGAPNAGARCSTDADCAPGTCTNLGSCRVTECSAASSNPGAACNSDANCANGECGPALFDVAGLASSGVGPVVLPRFGGGGGICQEDTSDTCALIDPCGSGPCVEYALAAQNPVPLEGLEQSHEVFAFAVNEGVDNKDRNGDGDQFDTVITLQDRETGIKQALPAPAPCTISGTPEGRAIIRVQQPPFSFPAVATEGDVVAFLESEAATNDSTSIPPALGCDANTDTDRIDPILRVFRLGPTEITSGAPRVVDAAPLINDRSLVVSNSHVFYRAPEAADATRLTELGSVGFGGVPANGKSQIVTGGLSADGQFLVFESIAANLISGGTNGINHVFLYDRLLHTTEVVSVDSSEVEGNSTSLFPSMTPDERFVAFASAASNLVPGDTNGMVNVNNGVDVFVRDRTAGTTERVSVDSDGNQADFSSQLPDISADGRFVIFVSSASNLVPGDGNGGADVFVRDRTAGTTVRVNVDAMGQTSLPAGEPPSISADGRFVSFTSGLPLLPEDTHPTFDIYVRDMTTGSLDLVSVSSSGSPSSNGDSFYSDLSDDGRFVVFRSTSTDLVPGDTNGAEDIFVRDRLARTTERVSVDSNGIQGNQGSGTCGVVFMRGFNISGDGRYVVFNSTASNLVPGDGNGKCDVFVRDRLSGTTERLSVDSTGGEADADSFGVTVSPDGRFAAFASAATNLVTGFANAFDDIFVRGIDPAAVASDATGDGQLDDTVLEVLDSSSNTVTALCPTKQVSVAGGAAAFLRPEVAGPAPNLESPGPGVAGCPIGTVVSGGISLNGDSDPNDAVIHYFPGTGSVQNLSRAASAVALSGLCTGGTSAGLACSADGECPGATCAATWVAALISEADQNNTQLNADGDTSDDVLQVHHVVDPPTTWINTAQAVDALQAVGNLVVILTPEAAQAKKLNGDRDKSDRVLQVYDAATDKLTNVREAAEEFVVGRDTDPCTGGPLVAFRTSEAAQDNSILNGDSDSSDFVLQAWSKGLGLINTGQAVTPCRLEACDPRQPYRVHGSTVKFLSFEPEQGQDLNVDGDQTDLILEQFDACTRTITIIGPVDPGSGAIGDPLDPDPQQPVVITPAGRCYQGLTQLLVPASCLITADCPSGSTCQSAPVVGTLQQPPTHDAVVLPRKPLTVKIKSGASSASAVLKVQVRNADATGNATPVRLSVADGNCPAGTVTGLPDFDDESAGVQDSVTLEPGDKATALVQLSVSADAFTTHNGKAPHRCTLQLTASAVVAENVDPTPRNNVLAVELNVSDHNDPAQAVGPTAHESMIRSAKPAKLTIGNPGAAAKTVMVRVTNADILPTPEAGHAINIAASSGDCPAGTIGVLTPVSVTVAGGASAKVAVPLTVTSGAVTTLSKLQPTRCTVTLTATTNVGGNVEPDATNNTTQLVIDVVDKNDF